jgi:RNA polymerase sigma factor (TIGR02999 family)
MSDPLQPVSPPAPLPAGDVTLLLHRLQSGEGEAYDRLFPLVYDQLRAAARRALARDAVERPLQPTELVHEAYLKLLGPLEVPFRDRAHFLSVAARAMRQILVDQARRRRAGKRGGGARAVSLHDGDLVVEAGTDDLLALDDALGRLEPRLRAVVEYRFFGGLTERETADVLGVTERTVQRDWVRARAWLHKEIYPSAGSA